MNTNTKTVKGFTLIELLVVIGILAVLSVVIILTLNPAELLKQARDSTRVSDLATLKTAISLYQVDQNDVKLGDGALCFPSLSAIGSFGAVAGCDPDGVTATLGPRFSAGTPTAPAAVTAIDGTGWVRVNIGAISTGSGGPPISALPLDPSSVVASNLFYAYRAGGVASCGDGVGVPRCTTYEINVVLESAKFVSQLTNDGGNDAVLYEVGTDPGLDL